MSVLEFAGPLVLARRLQGESEDSGCLQCVRVVLSEQSVAAGEGVAQKLLGLLVLAERGRPSLSTSTSNTCDRCDTDSEAVVVTWWRGHVGPD